MNAQTDKADKAKITVEVNNLGLYPEFIRNRSFEDSDTLQNWKFITQNDTLELLMGALSVNCRSMVPDCTG